MSHLEQLAAWIATVADGACLPAAVAEDARLHVLDTLAAIEAAPADAGGDDPGARAALAHRLEVDDIFDEALLCIGCLVVPTALDLGVGRGRDTLASVVAGYEAMGRLGLALGSARLLQRGWWPTAVCGAFGVAAAAARAFRLTPVETAHALALAAQRAGGLSGGDAGSQGRNLLCEHLVAAGIGAARAARADTVGPLDILDGPRGLGAALGCGALPAALTDGLGEWFVVSRTSLKPYACARQLHAAAEALLRLRDGVHLASAAVEIELPPLAAGFDRPVADDPLPATPAASAQVVAAVALARGSLLPPDLTPDAVAAPTVLGLARQVRVRLADDLPPLAGQVRVRDERGVREQAVCVPVGAPSRPLTREQVEEKARRLAGERAEALVARVSALFDAAPPATGTDESRAHFQRSRAF